MPARSSFVPKYCLHKPSGRAYVRIRGKVVYVGDYGSDESKQQYGRLVAEFTANPAPNVTANATEKITVVEVIDAYWLHAQCYYRKDGKPTRQLDAIRLALRPVRRLYGTSPAVSFGPLALRAIQQQLVETGCSRLYVNRQVEKVKRMFKWAVSVEMLPPATYQALATVPGLKKGRTKAHETEPVQPVPDATVDATLPHLPQVVADMVRFEQFTGCRPGEACMIRPCDVDRSDEIWQYRPESHKTEHHGRERIIYVGPKAQQVLLPYLLRDAQVPCFQPVESEQKRRDVLRTRRKTRVQPSQQNRRKARPKCVPKTAYTKDSYNRAIQRACEVAFGMPKELRNVSKKLPDSERKRLLKLAAEWRAANCWSPNQLRHSKATEIRREFGLEAAQVVLGHAKADVTQIYAERDSRLGAEVARRIG